MRRVTWGSLLQLALLVFAATTVIGYFSGLDFAQMRTELSNATWSWIVAGILIAQTPRIFQAFATLGSVATRLPLIPVYVMQLATGFMNVALPSALARASVNVRFFQRQGIPAASALASGAIDSLAGNVVQVMLLVLLLTVGGKDLNLDLGAPSADGLGRLIVVLAAVAILSVGAMVLVTPIRRRIVTRIREWWPEVRAAFRTIQAPRKLVLLVGGNVASEVLFATALGLVARGVGYSIPLDELLVINLSVALFASLIPVPGGIGVTEAGLMIGLTTAGLTEGAALTTAILFRIATFYLPPTWGWFALRWLRLHRYV